MSILSSLPVRYANRVGIVPPDTVCPRRIVECPRRIIQRVGAVTFAPGSVIEFVTASDADRVPACDGIVCVGSWCCCG